MPTISNSRLYFTFFYLEKPIVSNSYWYLYILRMKLVWKIFVFTLFISCSWGITEDNHFGVRKAALYIKSCPLYTNHLYALYRPASWQLMNASGC